MYVLVIYYKHYNRRIKNMSGIVGSRFNTRGSGLVGSLGTDGQVFTSSGAGASAVFEAAAAGGKILQVVTAVDTAHHTSTSTSFVTASSAATVAITPSATSSKIYVVCSCNMSCNDGNDGWLSTIYRDSTNLGNATSGLASGNSVPGVSGTYFPATMTVLDSPSSTSELTYQLYIALIDVDADGANVHIGATVSGTSNPVPSHMTCFEVGA
jgi:hypothetical protein